MLVANIMSSIRQKFYRGRVPKRETTAQPLSSPSLFSSMIDGGNMP